jgi:hypothetical protein
VEVLAAFIGLWNYVGFEFTMGWSVSMLCGRVGKGVLRTRVRIYSTVTATLKGVVGGERLHEPHFKRSNAQLGSQR